MSEERKRKRDQTRDYMVHSEPSGDAGKDITLMTKRRDTMILEEKRTAIIFTANTPHLAHANLMIESLRDSKRGNFHGDLWVISTGLSVRAKNYCDSQKIKYLESNLASLQDWNQWKKIAEAQPEYAQLRKTESEEESLRICFETYRNKRMSKLIILDWVEKFGSQYDFIALGDNDLLFQKDVNQLFYKEYSKDKNTIHYGQEEYEILPGSWLWNKDFHFSRLEDASEIDWGSHEINIGFILGTPQNMKYLFESVKKDFFSLNISLFTEFNWHDQDLVRVARGREPKLFTLMEEGDIAHLCAGGDNVVEERSTMEFYYKKNEKKPYIVHFAGGLWKKYPSVSSTYKVNPDTYYFTKEIEPSYDVIRKGSIINIFDTVSSAYYTNENKKSKEVSRQQWIKRYKNGKHKFLFIGWLETGTHKSTSENLPGLFKNSEIDLAVLNGNVVGKSYEDFICEQFPKIIAELTRVTKDSYLVRTYGFYIPNIPEWIFEDTIKSAMIEYRCPRKTALALANICYYYFSDALSFYKPELVLLWGFLSPWGKLINNLCKWKEIPISSLEWGILPGTVAFDFCGHMGDSWVTTHADYFNTLSLTQEDIDIAQGYLKNAMDPALSRNVAQDVDPLVVDEINRLKESGKKIILYMESNSAHSGNSYSDEARVRHHSPIFDDDCDSYKYISALCEKHPDWHILYKPHPISISRGLKTEINRKTTTVVLKGGLNETLNLSDISVTILSQGAYVSMISGVPCVILGNMQLVGSGSAYTVKNKEEIEKALELAIQNGIDQTQEDLFRRHVARALKYYLFKAKNEIVCRDSSDLTKTLCQIIDGKACDYYRYEMEAYNRQKPGENKVLEDRPLVSVIMPVYNAGEYLSSCIDSICNQSYQNWELLCVNNGSTDDSEDILNYYSYRDSRIRTCRQDEPNQRIARNWGIDHAKGKYVYLIDSDDYLDPNAIKTLVEVAEEKKSDLVYFFFKEVRTDNDPVRPRPRYYTYRRFFPEKRVFKLDKKLYKFFIQYPFPWGKLMRRDMMLENGLYFDLDCSNFDDNPHNLRTLLSAQNPYVVNEQFYNFRIHNKSMTQSKNPRILGMVDAVRIMNQIFEEKDCYQEFQKWYVPYKVHLVSWAWGFLPEELKKEYYDQIPNLIYKSDESYFVDDEVWSYYEMPSSGQVHFVKKMLHDSDLKQHSKSIFKKEVEERVEGKNSDPNDQKESAPKKEEEVKVGEENSNLEEQRKIIFEKEKEVTVEKEAWEKISKPHLYAIKVCEKLHIIKFAIAIKGVFKKS